MSTNPTRAYLTRMTLAAMALATVGAVPLAVVAYQTVNGTVVVPVLVGAVLGAVAVTISAVLFATVSGELNHPRADRLHLNPDRWGDQNILDAVDTNLNELRRAMLLLTDGQVAAVNRNSGRHRWTRTLARARAWRTAQWSGRWADTPGNIMFKTIQVADTLGPAFTDTALATAVADLIDFHDLGVLRLPWTSAGLRAPRHPYATETATAGPGSWSPLPQRVTS